MNDLKEFWDKAKRIVVTDADKYNIDVLREAQGLFFWERGGKQFVLAWKGFHPFVKMEKSLPEFEKLVLIAQQEEKCKVVYARDFLDALACLGEERIKELIKELK